MTIEEAIKSRHAVRAYTEEPISAEIGTLLNNEVEACNAQSGLHIQFITNDAKAFDCMMAHYGKFKNVKNYFALIGKKGDEQLDRKCGYYGERLVLLSQQLGLNTCWVAMSFKKNNERLQMADDEKLVCVIAVGYGETQGVGHKIKTYEDVCNEQSAPDWFKKGVEAALLAPTSLNQQRFKVELKDGKGIVTAKWGFYTKIDAGIAQYHFDITTNQESQI